MLHLSIFSDKRYSGGSICKKMPLFFLSSVRPPAEDEDENIAICLAAADLGAIGAYIKAVPNQPLVFTVR